MFRSGSRPLLESAFRGGVASRYLQVTSAKVQSQSAYQTPRRRPAGIACLAVLIFALIAALGTGPAAADLVSHPSIEGEAVSHVTATDATLEAQINPGGLETTYEVWVGTVSCIEFGGPADTCQSTSPGQIVGTIRAGGSTQAVSVDVAKAWRKLAPNSLYVFSVSAANSAGKTSSDVKVFKTAAGAQPTIVSESASNITPTDATLETQINTEGLETTYEFQLLWHLCPPGTEPLGCEAMIQGVPLPSGQLLGSFVGQSVSLELNSAGVTLHPHAEYDYRVVASNAAGSAQEPPSHAYGSAEGGWQSFITPEDAVQPLTTTTSPGSQSTTGPASNAGKGTATPAATNPVGTVTPLPNVMVLTNAQKLAKAVRACKRKPRKRRARCVKLAHKKYATTATKAKKS